MVWRKNYSSIPKYGNLIAWNGKTQIFRKLSRIQNFANYKSFLEII